MNIAMVSLDFPPAMGGIAVHVYELSKALSMLGHNITVFTRKFPSLDDYGKTDENIEIFKFKLRFATPVYGWQINRFIKKNLPALEPDIIHIHGMAPLEGYNIKDIPLVYTNHTSGYLRRIEKGGIRRMALIKKLFKKPDLFLAPSRELLNIPFGITVKKIFIPNGVDSKKYIFNKQNRRTLRGELNISDTDILGILTRTYKGRI